MATTTPTIRTTTTTFVSCAAESGRADAFSFRSLYRAWLACRKRKRGTRNAQRYEIRLLDRLVDTRAALAARTWSPGRSVCFVTIHPKAREIHAADFADRVMHHLLVPRLEALYEPVFIHDSYSNRIGKGTHAAVDRLQTFMRRVTRNGARRAWYLQLDIRNFFNTIDRHSLLDQLLRRIGTQVSAKRLDPGEAEQLAWLCRSLLDKHPAEDVVHRGDPRSFARVPEHKRLSAAPPGKGLPIGNLTSQFFANVYLNELDQFVKHTLKCRCYVRYVDDFVLLHEDRTRLIEWRDAIRNFLTDQLELDLKHDGILRPVANGADFLGYIARPDYRLVRRRVIGHLRERLDGISRLLVKEDAKGCSLTIRKEHREALRATLASYWGHFHHADTHRLINALWCRYPWLGELFRLSENDRLVPLWEPASVTSLRSQWRWFKSQRPTDLLLMQVGNSVAVFDEDTVKLPPLAGLAAMTQPRAGFGEEISLPLRCLKSLRQRLRQRRVAHCFVAEEGYLKLGMKRRVLRLVWRPIPAVGVRGVQTCHA
jgi:RNA-directed DNA polymerase